MDKEKHLEDGPHENLCSKAVGVFDAHFLCQRRQLRKLLQEQWQGENLIRMRIDKQNSWGKNIELHVPGKCWIQT